MIIIRWKLEGATAVRIAIALEFEVIDKQLEELLVEQLRFDDLFETEIYVMVEWMNDLIEFVMDNEMSIVDWVELIDIVMVKSVLIVKTVVEIENCCRMIDKVEDLEEEPAPTIGETSAPPAPKTAKQLAARRNQERVKIILLLAIPDEYLLKFHNVADAKSLWEAIKSRFGGNVESKKMQKMF
ncbi:hypothetical protein Tco_0956494 [Tanacetum coccineum]